MKQVLIRQGRAVVEEMPVPVCGRGEILVRTAWSLISTGTETATLRNSTPDPGHGEERVIWAIQEQVAELPYAAPGMTTKIRALASKTVAEVTPHQALTKVLFTLGGADANENAIKLARGYTGRHKILTRYRSYHGATAGAMAATGDPRHVAWEPNLMTGVVHFLDPYRYRSTFHRMNPDIPEREFAQDYLNHLEEIIQYEDPDSVAAVLIESVTGTNGIIIPPEGYLQGVRALYDKYGIVMIADEVMRADLAARVNGSRWSIGMLFPTSSPWRKASPLHMPR